MGVLISNKPQRITKTALGVTQTVLEPRAFAEGIKVLSVSDVDQEGKAKTSRADGSHLATASCQVTPGKAMRITAYEDEATKLMAIAPGSLVNAELEPMGLRGGELSKTGFRLVKLVSVTPPPAPAATAE